MGWMAMRVLLKSWIPAVAVLVMAGCSRKPVVPVNLGFEVVAVIPHDPEAYTQGLQLADGRLFEGTGHYSKSSIREVNPQTGEVLRKRNLPADHFGEGITLHGGELWMLTWKESTAYVMDPETFRTLRTFKYEGEGWGLTSDGKQLIMSDGSNVLEFRETGDFSVAKTVGVTDEGRPLKRLNELEYIRGSVFSNVYMTDRIARIDPGSGEVTGWLDLSSLRAQLPRPHRAEVLNGIAYDEKSGNLLVTGKYWPRMFVIRLKEN